MSPSESARDVASAREATPSCSKMSFMCPLTTLTLMPRIFPISPLVNPLAALDDGALGSGVERLTDIARTGEGCQNEDAGVRVQGFDSRCRFRAAELGHHDVHDDDIRREWLGEGDGFDPRGCFAPLSPPLGERRPRRTRQGAGTGRVAARIGTACQTRNRRPRHWDRNGSGRLATSLSLHESRLKPRGASNRHASWCERGSCNSPYSICYNFH